ncbi:serine peptidase P1 [Pterostylis polerovirus]|nr:serine peptidase P1 [Pterostylis polerovirus]
MNSSFLFALIFLSFTCCHSSSSMEWNSGLTGWFASPNNTIVPYFGTEFVLAGPPPYDCKPEKCELTFPQCPLLSSTDYSYNELISAFYRKASVDALTLSRNTRGKLSVLLTQSLKTLKSLTHTLIEYLLATLAWAWVNCLMLSVSLVWFILTSYTLNALIIAWCLVCTIFIYKAMVWTFSKLPIFAITWPMKMCWRVLKFRRPSQTKTVDEKAVEGYRSFTVNMKPPKSAVLQLIYEKGDHAGYANCIRLYNGENALITAYHNGVDLTVVGKTGNKIPLSQFKELFAHPPTDIRILVGPPNWEGCLGCKGAHFTTGDRVGKCPASFFTLYDGDWQSNSAQIVGSFDKYATVLSNTDFGDSGTGYYNGKTLLGIHKGHPATGENFNLMAVIPPIPGLTTPRFVYETTMPQGRIFSDEMVKMLHDLKNFKPIGGGLSWAEQVDLGDEKKPRESGNGEGSSDCQNKRPLNIPAGEQTGSRKLKVAAPKTPTTITATVTPPCQAATATTQVAIAPGDLAAQVIEHLCARVNLSTLEAAVVEKLASQALKKRPQRKRGGRGGRTKPSNILPTSSPSMTGKYQPPHVRFPASATVVKSPPTIIPPRNEKRNGGGNSVGLIPNWVRKPQALGGPRRAPKQN